MIWDILFRAFVIGAILSILLSVMSYFVVMRRMTFAGVGIAHSAFGGVALNFLLGFSGYVIPLLFSALASFLIAFMYRRGKISEDSAIDVIFVFSMAFGVFILSLSEGYSANLLGVLFGSILSVGSNDLYITLIVAVPIFVFITYFFSHLHLITYNEELAYIAGVRVEVLYYLFWLVLAFVIVLSIKLIGIILVNAFLVLPTLIGMNLAKNYRSIILCGLLMSVISVGAGIFSSYLLNTPAGATIVLLFVVMWGVSFLFKRIRA